MPNKMTTRSTTVDLLALELGERTRWQGDKISGGPMRGITGLNRGILPEPYWTAAEDAVYAVYHYETPIAWETEAGIWYVPNYNYGQTTTTFRNKIVGALGKIGVEFELI